MTRDRALTILREHEAELKGKGVAHLRLFGSVARDEATDESDVDVLADFDGSGPAAKQRIGGLQLDLSEMLGTQVDLSTERWLKESVRLRAQREAVLVF